MAREDLNQQVRDRADAIKAEAQYDESTNSSHMDKEKSEDIFSRFLPADLTLDQVKQSQEELLLFAAAGTLANGELQQERMVANKDLKVGSMKLTVGHSIVETSYERSRSGTAMGKPWEKFGVANTDFILGAGRKKTDQKQVVAYLGEEAKSVFSN